MRTTVDIPTPLFKRAKAAATKEGVTLRVVLVRALEAYLAAPAATKPYRFEWKGVSLGRIPDAELWKLMKDRDRRWIKEYLSELETRHR